MADFQSGTPHPWSSIGDIDVYLADAQSEFVRTEASLGSFDGYTYESDFFDLNTTVHQLLYGPETRLFVSVYPAGTTHAAEVEEILSSIALP